MKTIVLLVSLCFSLLICNGQSLVQENKLWSNTSIGTMTGSTYESYFIKFMGDTTINGLAYKKIMKSMDELKANWSSFGYIREETNTGKVFIYNKYAKKDILLYDFSLEEGDSILTGDGVSYAKVTKVIHETFGNSPVIRKQIYFFDTSGTSRWIEGIGSTWGVLEGLNSFFTTGATTSLVCYHENDELIYHNAKFGNCFPKGSDSLIVDAGNDTTYCVGAYSTEIPMGLKVNIQNGVEPYTYAWECLIVPFGILKPRTASDILNDSTLISPNFKSGVGGYADQIILKLHVTDHAGNTGTDSIRVRFSRFAHLTGYSVVEINKGDSTQFKFSSVGGGIEPLTYQWQPKTGLSDPDSLVTWAKPEISTQYNIIATDSCGCVSEPNLAYEVRVKQPNTEPITNTSLRWNIGTHCVNEGPMNPYDRWSTSFLHIEGDTIMNQQHYKKLISCVDSICDKKNLKSYIREEAGKVYLANKSNEVLRYDFNLQKGDTMIMNFLQNIGVKYYIRVDSVKSMVLRDQKERIAQYVTVFDYHDGVLRPISINDVFVEGIGSIRFGLEYPMDFFTTGDQWCSTNLLCFYSSKDLVYSDPKINSCYLYTGINPLEQVNLIKLYNYEKGKLEIQLSEVKAGKLIVFDINGKQVLIETIHHSGTSLCLPLSGIYLYKFEAEKGKVQTGKVLVK